jgi:hypothetical protein
MKKIKVSTVAERDKKKYRLSEKHASQSKPASKRRIRVYWGVFGNSYSPRKSTSIHRGFDFAQPPGFVRICPATVRSWKNKKYAWWLSRQNKNSA